MSRTVKLSSDYLWIVVFWVVVTALNLTKAVHMDDTVYLYGARSVSVNPLEPYAGKLIWGSLDYVPFSSIAQPALTFYGLALSLLIFGEREIPLHLVESLYSLLAIVCFYRLTKLLRSNYPIIATALFCISPAFIPSQNLMTDIPLVSLILLFLLVLFTALDRSNSFFSFLLSGLVAGLACLIKYSGAILFPVYFVALIFKRSWRSATSLFVPLLLLVGWGIFTYSEVGTVHIFRPQIQEAGDRFYRNVIDWIVCLGGLAPFSILYICKLAKKPSRLIGSVVGLSLLYFYYPRVLDGDASNAELSIMARIFWVNGILVFLGTAFLGVRSFCNSSLSSDESANRGKYLLMLTLLLSSFLFITIFSRFIAVRHLLLALPVILLIGSNKLLEGGSSFGRFSACLLTGVLGIGLGISDWCYADLYREKAWFFAESYRSHPQIWANGSWGWQWYAIKNGMKPYTVTAPLQNHDIVIVPHLPTPIRFSASHSGYLFKRDLVTVEAPPTTWLRTMWLAPWGGYYSSTAPSGPWRFTHDPLEQFEIFEYLDSPNERMASPIELRLAEDISAVAGLEGFYPPEWWGRWSSQSRSAIHFATKLPKSFRLNVRAIGFGANAASKLRIRVGVAEASIPLTDQMDNYSVEVTAPTEEAQIEFLTQYSPSSPADLSGGVGDQRVLGVGIESVGIIPAA